MVSAEYCAGMFDGEGSVIATSGSKSSTSAYRRCKTPEAALVFRMTVVNSNREVCEAFKKRYGGNICYVKSYGRCRELWRWHLTGARQLYHAVDDMLPHSIVKRDQLVALSIALQSYGHNAGGAGLSLEQRTLRRLGWLKIRHLNADRHNGRRQHEAQHVFDAIREAQVTQGV